MVHSIEVWRHRIDELAHELLTDEFVVDKANLEELVCLSRELDNLWARRINFLEGEVDSLRLEHEKMYAANETRIKRIKSLCTTLYRASISNSIQYTLLLVSNTTLVHWPCTVLGYTGRLVIQ